MKIYEKPVVEEVMLLSAEEIATTGTTGRPGRS